MSMSWKNNCQADYPWMAALVVDGEIFCGATLISNQWLATSAHCLIYEEDRECSDAGNGNCNTLAAKENIKKNVTNKIEVSLKHL